MLLTEPMLLKFRWYLPPYLWFINTGILPQKQIWKAISIQTFHISNISNACTGRLSKYLSVNVIFCVGWCLSMLRSRHMINFTQRRPYPDRDLCCRVELQKLAAIHISNRQKWKNPEIMKMLLLLLLEEEYWRLDGVSVWYHKRRENHHRTALRSIKVQSEVIKAIAFCCHVDTMTSFGAKIESPLTHKLLRLYRAKALQGMNQFYRHIKLIIIIGTV